jgi:choline-phosphate cytidylyltransferase
MMKSRQTNRDGQHGSDSSEEDSDERSPPRGRTGNAGNSSHGEEIDSHIEVMVDENSKSSGA